MAKSYKQLKGDILADSTGHAGYGSSKKALGETTWQDYEKAKSARNNFNTLFQDCRDYVRPNASDFNRSESTGQARTQKIYDSTAPWSLTQFAGGLHSHLTNPTERWFGLSTVDGGVMNDPEALAWMEVTSDLIYHVYCQPDVRFHAQIHETYLDLGGFGTGVLYQDWGHKAKAPRFRSIPLADCYIQENFEGIVDTVYRKVMWNKRQLMQRFGQKATYPKAVMECKEPSKMFEVCHCVRPNSDYNPLKSRSQDKEFSSVWVINEEKCVLEHKGYSALPYHITRWNKMAGEAYGRSPGMDCMPSIRMLNKMKEVCIKAAQLAIAPPMMLPDEAYMKPIKTTPFALNYYDAGRDSGGIEKLPIDAQGAQMGLEYMSYEKEDITKAYFVNYILATRKKERQTAYEVADDRDEQLRMMAPMLGRTTSELIGPTIARTFDLMWEAGQIPIPPQNLQGRKLKVVYMSPASQAQLASKGINIQRFLQAIIPAAQVDPTVFDGVNFDALAAELALYSGVTRKIIRSPEERDGIRQQKAQQQMLMQGAAAGKDIASAAKDTAQAQAISAGSE